MNKPNFFSQGSPYLAHPLLTAERTSKEIDFVLAQAKVPPGGRFLDVGCGPGRHSIELARRGYRVVGIDPARAMIEAAQQRAGSTQWPTDPAATPTFIQVAGDHFKTDEAFDAAICLFTSLGQMDKSGDNRGLVERVFGALKPGGIFIVEVPNKTWLVENLKAGDRFEGDKLITLIERRYDPAKSAVTETFTLISPGGQDKYLLRYRLFNKAELQAILEAAGFRVPGAFGSYQAEPWQRHSPIIILAAQKP